MKRNEISTQPKTIYTNDIVGIKAVIRNYLWQEATGINIICYVGDPSLPESVLIGLFKLMD